MIAGLGFMGWLVWRMINSPEPSLARFEWHGLVACVGIGVAANAIVGIAFADLVGKLAPSVPWGRRLAAYYHSQIAKYVPGRVAALFVQRSILNGPGATSATLVSNVELAAISAGLACTMAAGLFLASSSLPIALAVLATGTWATTWLLRADWRPLVRRMTRTGNQTGGLAFTRIGVPRAVALALGMLLLPAASSYALVRFGVGTSATESVVLTAMLLLSWVAGMAAILFPAGLGARELAFMALGGAMPEPPSIELLASIAVASRAAQVLMDIVGVAGFACIERLLRSDVP